MNNTRGFFHTRGSSDTKNEPPLDLRLLPTACGAWACAWLVPVLPAAARAAFVFGLLAVAVRWRRTLTVSAAALACVAVVVSMMVRLVLLDQDPMHSLARDGRAVVVTGTLTADPVLTERLGFGSSPQQQVRVELRVEQLEIPGQSWLVRVPVVVMGDGEGWQDVRLGAQVRLRGTLAPEESARPVAAMLFSRGPPERLEEPAALMRGTEQMRQGLRDSLSGTSPDVRGLLPALVVGDTGALSPQLVEDLRSSGLTHLTAVSGANVAIVLIAMLFVARSVRVRGYGLPFVGLVTVCWFVLLARPEPSVLRAAVMGVLGVIAVVATGQRKGPRLLLGAVVLLLIIDPWLSRSWGFALSVAATAGLLVLARRWSDRWSVHLPRPLAEGAAVALAAQVATIPLSVALSGQVAVWSVPANVFAAPAVAPATILGAAAAAVSPVFPPLASVFAWTAQWPTGWIAAVAHRTAVAPLANWPWPSGWPGALLTLALLALLTLVLRWCRRARVLNRRRSWMLCALVAVLLLAYIQGPGRWPPNGWLVAACDVGQGDAIAVSTGPNSALVVDTGPSPTAADRCLDRLGVDQIPLLVLTHAHADHVRGLPGVLEDRSVGTLMVSPLQEPEDQMAQVANWAASTPVVVAAPGQSGEIGGVTWEVIWPERIIHGDGSDPNNASVVLMVETQGVRVLLSGDIEPAAQRALALSRDDLAADVLKVPHHGSRYQDQQFWQEVNPRVALVSVGEENTYGHPAPELLDALTAAGILLGRTDTQGTVAVVDADGLRIITQR